MLTKRYTTQKKAVEIGFACPKISISLNGDAKN
jgi:hypothetical protein